MFGEDDYLRNTISKDSTKNTDEALIEIYEKLRPGEPATFDSSKNQIITRFFDEFRYDLSKVGRYKFNKKLNVIDRLLDQTLAEDILVDGNIAFEKGTKVTKTNVKEVAEALKSGFGLVDATANEELDNLHRVQMVKIQDPTDKKKNVIVIGNDQDIDVKRLTISDVYASVSTI